MKTREEITRKTDEQYQKSLEKAEKPDNSEEIKRTEQRPYDGFKEDANTATQLTYMLFQVQSKFSEKSPDYQVSKPKADGKGFINKIGVAWEKTKNGKKFIVLKINANQAQTELTQAGETSAKYETARPPQLEK